jgi:hypothetical protein
LKINDTRIKEALNSDSPDFMYEVMSSIAGKYVYMEIPFMGELVCEQLENEEGEVMYFRSEKEALDLLEELKNK